MSNENPLKTRYFSHGGKKEEVVSTTDISRLLGFTVSAKFIKNELKVFPAYEPYQGVFWFKSQVPEIIKALISLLESKSISGCI